MIHVLHKKGRVTGVTAECEKIFCAKIHVKLPFLFYASAMLHLVPCLAPEAIATQQNGGLTQ